MHQARPLWQTMSGSKGMSWRSQRWPESSWGEISRTSQPHLQNLKTVHKRELYNFPEPEGSQAPQQNRTLFIMLSHAILFNWRSHILVINSVQACLFIYSMFSFYCIEFLSVCYVIYLKQCHETFCSCSLNSSLLLIERSQEVKRFWLTFG